MESFKWSYGRQIRLGDCMNLEVGLPFKDGKLNFEFMEQTLSNAEEHLREVFKYKIRLKHTKTLLTRI